MGGRGIPSIEHSAVTGHRDSMPCPTLHYPHPNPGLLWASVYPPPSQLLTLSSLLPNAPAFQPGQTAALHCSKCVGSIGFTQPHVLPSQVCGCASPSPPFPLIPPAMVSFLYHLFLEMLFFPLAKCDTLHFRKTLKQTEQGLG